MSKKQKPKFSKNFIVDSLVYFSVVYMLSVILVYVSFKPDQVYALFLKSLIVALFVFPLAFLLLLGILLAVFGLVLSGVARIPKSVEGDDPVAEQSRQLEELGYRRADGATRINTIALNGETADQRPVRAVYAAKHDNADIRVYLYDDFTIVQYTSGGHPAMPSFVINSLVNDDSRGMVDVRRIEHVAIDAGSDFGRYVSLSVVKSGEVDVLQIMDPTLMLDWMGKGLAFDTVVTGQGVDYKFDFTRVGMGMSELLGNVTELSRKIESGVNGKGSASLATQMFTLKKGAAPVTKMLDVFTISLIKVFGIFIAAFLLLGALSERAPYFVLVLLGIITLAFFALSVIRLLLILNAFCIYICSSFVIKILLKLRVAKLARNYQYIQGKYN